MLTIFWWASIALLKAWGGGRMNQSLCGYEEYYMCICVYVYVYMGIWVFPNLERIGR